MSFWVREKRLPNGKWIPDVEEGMCLDGTRLDAEVLLEGCEDDPNYRLRRYRRIPDPRPRRRPWAHSRWYGAAERFEGRL